MFFSLVLCGLDSYVMFLHKTENCCFDILVQIRYSQQRDATFLRKLVFRFVVHSASTCIPVSEGTNKLGVFMRIPTVKLTQEGGRCVNEEVEP